MRVVLALLLVGASLDGRPALGRDIWLLVASWSSDMIDGRLSRSLNTDHTTWLGKNDVYIDMLVSVAVLFYLAVTGLLMLWLALLYLLIWGALFLRYGIPPLLAQLFQNPIYAYFVFLTVQAEPALLPWLLLWACVFLLLFWRRALELYYETVRSLRN
jgi:hypothetical protein